MKTIFSVLLLLCLLTTGCRSSKSQSPPSSAPQPHILLVEETTGKVLGNYSGPLLSEEIMEKLKAKNPNLQILRITSAEMTPQEMQIAEAVLTYMFTHATNWGKDINRRFVACGFNRIAPDQLIENLRKNTELNVLSPFIQREDYLGRWNPSGKYEPQGDDSLFYSVSHIKLVDDTTATVDCSVTWALLAAYGYTYELRYEDSVWKVVKTTLTWLS